MAAAKKKLSVAEAAQAFEALVDQLSAGEIVVCILGTQPLILNTVNLKAKHELLFPRVSTKASREASLKHDPLMEYRNSVYRRRPLELGPTRLVFPCPAYKGVLNTAALDLPSEVTKAKIGRLTWVKGDTFDIYGVPQMFMSVVRNSGIGRTPDIRTRAILPHWCCRVNIRFMRPILNERILSGLLTMGGLTVGIGDFRQEKGKGSYGQFELCQPDNPVFKAIIAEGGMVAQDAALEKPDFYDAGTEELYSWFVDEVALRGKEALRGGDEEDEGEDDPTIGFGNGEDAELLPPV